MNEKPLHAGTLTCIWQYKVFGNMAVSQGLNLATPQWMYLGFEALFQT